MYLCEFIVKCALSENYTDHLPKYYYCMFFWCFLSGKVRLRAFIILKFCADVNFRVYNCILLYHYTLIVRIFYAFGHFVDWETGFSINEGWGCIAEGIQKIK